MQAKKGWVIVDPKRKNADGRVDLGGGHMIHVPGGYEGKHRLFNVIGNVISSGGPHTHKGHGPEWAAEHVVLNPGDMIWYSWTAQMAAYDPVDADPSRTFTDEQGNKLMIMPYSSVLAVVRDVDAFMGATYEERNAMIELVNGWIIGSEVHNEPVHSSVLDIPDMAKKGDVKKRVFRIEAMGAPNKKYFVTDPSGRGFAYGPDEYVDKHLEVGMHVVVDNAADVKMEGDYGHLLAPGMVRFQRRSIQAILGTTDGVSVIEAKSKVRGEDLREGLVDKEAYEKEQQSRLDHLRGRRRYFH